MYNFVFWFFYKFFEWRKKFKSPFLPASMVGLTMIIHLGLIHAFLRYFTGFNIGVISNKYGYNRLILLPIVLLWFFLVYQLYYKKRSDEILKHYSESCFYSLKNILYIILVIVVPLIVAIWLTNLAVKKA
ncbi:hypothetical protein A4R26_33735 [Niastella populi]|uniref:Uncharacterized protein n=1 Tax=Niastella populi TaxID=550983 RepID=A0A1V9G0W1_9BACT|nr:hypothetical protein A4R26_33735 [Niastella populi]